MRVGPSSQAGLGLLGHTGRAQIWPGCRPFTTPALLWAPPPPHPTAALTLREYLGLEALAEDEVLQVVEGLAGGLRDRTRSCTPGPAPRRPKGYGEGADEERGTQQPTLDGQPLGGGQLPAVHLHPGEKQQREQRGERQGGARAYGWGRGAASAKALGPGPPQPQGPRGHGCPRAPAHPAVPQAPVAPQARLGRSPPDAPGPPRPQSPVTHGAPRRRPRPRTVPWLPVCAGALQPRGEGRGTGRGGEVVRMRGAPAHPRGLGAPAGSGTPWRPGAALQTPPSPAPPGGGERRSGRPGGGEARDPPTGPGPARRPGQPARGPPWAQLVEPRCRTQGARRGTPGVVAVAPRCRAAAAPRRPPAAAAGEGPAEHARRRPPPSPRLRRSLQQTGASAAAAATAAAGTGAGSGRGAMAEGEDLQTFTSIMDALVRISVSGGGARGAPRGAPRAPGLGRAGPGSPGPGVAMATRRGPMAGAGGMARVPLRAGQAAARPRTRAPTHRAAIPGEGWHQPPPPPRTVLPPGPAPLRARSTGSAGGCLHSRGRESLSPFWP